MVLAAQLPSLFRGVVIADSPIGVRVVSVEERSQAALADLRAQDIIVSLSGQEVHSIDEFSVLSNTMKGKTTHTQLVIFRNGSPQELLLHLYSYPILRTWGIEFLPDHDLRFAQDHVGFDYWVRLGRGFQTAHKSAEALNAYLNALHLMPEHGPTALIASELYLQRSQQQFTAQQLAEGIMSMQHAVMIMEKLFDYPLTEEELRRLKDHLEDTLKALRTIEK